jgi:hypothetical protein
MEMAKSYAPDANESSAIDVVAADVRRLKLKSEAENEFSVVAASRSSMRF